MAPSHEATVIYPGDIKGRPTIELRVNDKGESEAYLVPASGPPDPSGVIIFESKGNYYVPCRIRKKKYKFKPEEVVRQRALNWTIDDLGYPEKQISVEVPIVIGGSVHDKAADIVIFDDTDKSNPRIIIEVKKPNRKDGIDQLKSYMNATGAIFGYWSNGVDEKFLLRTAPNDFSRPIWRLPRPGETLTDIDQPLTRENLSPVKDLYGVFKDIEQEILAHQSVDTFNEIFKIVFAKLYDERVNLHNPTAPARFRMGLTENSSSVAESIRDLYKKAKGKWKDVYAPADKIELTETTMSYCVQALQQYYLMRSGDVLGTAFELFVNQEMKGDKGQFFTPRQVVAMMVNMMNPTLSESLCDPACGSAGFLIYSMRKVFQSIEQRWDDADDRAEQRKDYAQEKVFCMDNDPRLVRVAKAYMIMENDGRSGVFLADSLDYDSWNQRLRGAIVGRELTDSEIKSGILIDGRLDTDGVDVILTNPPFAGAIKATTTLRQYGLSLDASGHMKNQMERAKLFLERCIDVLRPGGRLGIILPQGIFNNINDQAIRDFVADKCRILAVIGLHPYTFKPFTLAKTSVLFLQKWENGEETDDYTVFTAVSMRPGKTKLGRPQYLDDGVTLDCDMPEISSTFRSWANSEGLGFAK